MSQKLLSYCPSKVLPEELKKLLLIYKSTYNFYLKNDVFKFLQLIHLHTHIHTQSLSNTYTVSPFSLSLYLCLYVCTCV